MAFTTAQLTAIEEAIASGQLRVKYADKEVEYRSLSEMKQVRDLMRRDLGLISSGSTRIYPTVSKGIDSDGSDSG